MTPAQVALLAWTIGAVVTGVWTASLFRGGFIPTIETDDPHHARTFDLGVAFGAVLIVAFWPLCVPFVLWAGARERRK